MRHVALLFVIGVATALLPAGAVGENLGVNNQQHVSKPDGDASTVEQRAASGSHDNRQSAVVSSAGAVPNVTIQSTAGADNVQTSVQNGGQGNVVMQTQRGVGNKQTVVQTGSGNSAVQTQSGVRQTGHLDQRGGETGIQIQK